MSRELNGPLPEDVLTPREDLTREPFHDDRPQSITRPVGQRRVTADGEPWPPRTRGPLPADYLRRFDINPVTCLDEMDLWAAELDWWVTAYEEARKTYGKMKHAYELAGAKARRVARQNPLERGRRTSGDIDNEVIEATADEYATFLDAEAALDVAKTKMFAAKDQIERLRSALSAAKVLDPRGA